MFFLVVVRRVSVFHLHTESTTSTTVYVSSVPKTNFITIHFFVSAVNFHIFEAKSRLLQPVMSSPNNSTCRHTAFITVSETEGRACSGQSLFVCNSLPPSTPSPSLSSQSFLKDIFSQNFFVNFVSLFGVLSRPLTFFLSLSSLSFSVTL